MAHWRQILTHLASNADDRFDLLKQRLAERLGIGDPLTIVTYGGYGTVRRVYLRGRVLEDDGVTAPTDDDNIWRNIVNMYRRFESDEAPGARLRITVQDERYEATADGEGYFERWIEPGRPLAADALWHEATLELLEPQRAGQGPVTAVARIMVPPPTARLGVISDVDDTVVQTDAANLLRMARIVFLGNARTRLPFKGVAAFYRALHGGASGDERNPLFYVSSGPWNLYDLLVGFFELNDIPLKGMLFLRDWGVSREELLPTGHRAHKLAAIKQILDTYPAMPFILIGDSGQKDPEIYHEVVSLYPGRIMAVYIRNVSANTPRPEAINALAKEVAEAGSTLVLADNTLPMAQHAAERGWIDPARLPDIWAEKKADERPDDAVDALINDVT